MPKKKARYYEPVVTVMVKSLGRLNASQRQAAARYLRDVAKKVGNKRTAQYYSESVALFSLQQKEWP